MTRPKTYGEYANQAPNVTVDIRVRDREITDDMWRVLNAENELSPDIVEQFNMCGDKPVVEYESTDVESMEIHVRFPILCRRRYMV